MIALRIAAARQFEQFGYDQVGAADIANAAGLSRAGFYVYFRDKAHIAVSVLRPFVAVAFPTGGAPSNTAATANLEQLYGMINDNRRLVQCLEPLRVEAPGFVGEVDARILRWHGDLLEGAGLDARLAGLLSAMSIGLAWRPPAEQDWGVGGVTELLSPLMSRKGEGLRRGLCPPAYLDPGQADVSWRGQLSARS
ncbi:TetR/AcrR family transcriptional regulator [Phenylobacterium sp.]|uniref:TetR/AcrR family transcriptional regulator n=1 Tax=Phenylobacterium sp. TaxID=1871053 RepID=UPI002730F874|nr:TetR/AcrR family transcriptional regulator [Phenylobacterium sp.]MDP1873186.1 helix-turn-helix domain-containing protein [Phenylobacterium sp.]MDP3490606.1 helix-turn-helix domain-containing protein [Phenylobacterium sp.]